MIDIKLDPDGELVIDSNGDIAFTSGDDATAQEILFRLKTTKGDWTLGVTEGCSLERFIGTPNIEETWKLIEAVVETELTRDNLVVNPQIDCIQLDANSVMIIVEFDSVEEDARIIQISSMLDMRKGLVWSRVGSRTSF